MNIIFLVLSLASLALLCINSPESVFPVMIGGATSAIELVLKLLAIYSVWLSVLKMMERTGTDKFIAKMLKPITKRLFKGESDEAYVYISINFASNLLGMGGAATPAGMKAMKAMHKGGDTASANMILFLVIAATSIQLLPATVIALRSTAGSANATDILLPTLISSSSSTILAVVLCKILASIKTTEKEKTPKPKRFSLGSVPSCKPTLSMAQKEKKELYPVSKCKPTLTKTQKESTEQHPLPKSKTTPPQTPIILNEKFSTAPKQSQ